MNQQVLHRLVGLVRVVVPPAAVVHERLPGRVVLRAGDAYRTRLVERRQDSLDHVHEGRHAKLLSPGLTAGLERHGRAGHQQRRVDGRAEAAERRDEIPDRDSLRLGGLVLGRDRRGHGEEEDRSDDNSRPDHGHWPHSRQEDVRSGVPRSSAKTSIGRRGLSRFSCHSALGLLAALVWGPGAGEAQPARPPQIDVVASAVPRPAQLGLTSAGRLVVLSHGWRGDSAAEIYWLDPRAATPIDASRAPRLVIPFAEGPRKSAFGSLAIDPKSGDLFLGEESGNRIYRLVGGKRLTAGAFGPNHLLGGSRVAADSAGS